LGKTGFVEVGKQCMAKARYLRGEILKLAGYSAAFEAAPYFNEFAVRVRGGDAAKVCRALEQQNIIAGYDLGLQGAAHKDALLIAVTEKHRREDLERLLRALSAV
jgi:glycine dehydrogenase subunit 1